MGSMDAYEQVRKGTLKLKGVTELGVTKRKEKKDRDKAKLLETMGKNPEEPGGGAEAPPRQADPSPGGL